MVAFHLLYLVAATAWAAAGPTWKKEDVRLEYEYAMPLALRADKFDGSKWYGHDFSSLSDRNGAKSGR